ncbi:hypothetical protein IG631_06127 [Alternaria alternata]|nr:hypothetical protein IG631_06127 [Alternaria alternata]
MPSECEPLQLPTGVGVMSHCSKLCRLQLLLQSVHQQSIIAWSLNPRRKPSSSTTGRVEELRDRKPAAASRFGFLSRSAADVDPSVKFKTRHRAWTVQ